MNALMNILADPSEAFEQIKGKPRWFVPNLFCVITLFAVIWLGGCWRDIGDGFSPGRILGPALISLLIVGIVSVGSSLFLYLMILLVGGTIDAAPRFRSIFALNIHCAVILLLGEVFNLLLICSNVFGDLDLPLTNRFPVGLDLLFFLTGNPGIYLAVLFHCTSVFVLWYLVVLARGIRAFTGSSMLRSRVVAASLWSAAVLFVMCMVYAAGGGTTIRIVL